MGTWTDRLLDASVVASFDGRGFRRHARDFATPCSRDLTGQRVLVTGGTAGIGRAEVCALAARGAEVHVWGRRVGPGRELVDELAARGHVAHFSSVDLGDLPAVSRAAQALPAGPWAGVVLNAGAMPLCRTLTAQGHELVWASQVLGHVLLLRVLRSRGELTDQTRTIWVSSGGMYLADVDLRDLTRSRAYQRHQVYAVAKRCQVTLASSLAARWSDTWMGSMHPGWVDTAAVRHSMPWFHRITKSNLRTPEEGADTITWLVCEAKTGPSGRFWFDRREAPVSIPGRRPPTELDADDLLRMVWQQTEAFVR